MGILEGKRLLVTGVLMDSSIAFHVARIAQQEGATVVLSSYGRASRITAAIAKRLPRSRTGHRAGRDLDRGPGGAAGAPRRARRRPRRCAALHRFRPRIRARRELPQHHLGGRRHRGARVGVLPQGPGRRGAAADAAGRFGGGAHLRCDGCLAQVRLDGGGQGGLRVHRALPRPRPRPAGDPGQPGRGRTLENDRRQGDSRFLASSRTSGRRGPLSAGTSPIPRPPPRRAPRCSRTGSRRPPARSCTSTAACTRWAPSPAPVHRAVAGVRPHPAVSWPADRGRPL